MALSGSTSGYVDFTGSNYSSTQTLRVEYTETYDSATNSSIVEVTGLFLRSTIDTGYAYYGDFVLTVGGTTIVTASSATGNVGCTPVFGSFTEVKRSGESITGSVTIQHNADGTGNTTIQLAANRFSKPRFQRGTTTIFELTAGTRTVTLTTLPVGELSLSVSAGVTASVTRNGAAVGNGANLYYGDALSVSWSINTGYMQTAATLNGTTITSPTTHSVVGAVALVLSATYAVSEISTPNGTFGAAQTITVTQYDNSYTHSIVATCAGQSQTIATKSSSLSISWTPDPAIMIAILNSMSASCTLVCTTYDGDTALGSTSITITLSLPTSGTYSVLPTPSLAVSDSMGYATIYGAYVQSKSKLLVQVTDGLKYSATTASRSTTANGSTYTAASFTTNALTGSGTGTVATSVKDSRGQTGTASASISILAYDAPAISAFGVHRCDQDGTANDEGNYFKISYTVAVTALNNVNSKALRFRYREAGGAWGGYTSIPLSTYSESGESAAVDITTEVSNGTTLEVEIELSDDFGAATRTTTLSTVPVTFDFNASGNGLGIGKVSEENGVLDLKWMLRLRDSIIPIAVTDCNDAYDDLSVDTVNTSAYGVGYVLSGSSNAPTTSNGVLLTHKTGNAGNWGSQVFQGDAGVYYRAKTNGAWGSWLKSVDPSGPPVYITESGTANGWKYRKWSDGTAEAWYMAYSASTAVTTANGSLYKEGTQHTVVFPSGLFSARPVVTGSVSCDWYSSTPLFWLNIIDTAAANVVYEAWASQSVTRALRVELYARSA